MMPNVQTLKFVTEIRKCGGLKLNIYTENVTSYLPYLFTLYNYSLLRISDPFYLCNYATPLGQSILPMSVEIQSRTLTDFRIRDCLSKFCSKLTSFIAVIATFLNSFAVIYRIMPRLCVNQNA